jgi:hypothetical protein
MIFHIIHSHSCGSSVGIATGYELEDQGVGVRIIPIISQQTILGCPSTDAYAGICLMICLTDSNVLFLIVIFSS